MKQSRRQKLYTLILLLTTLLWGCDSPSEVSEPLQAYIMVHHEVFEYAEYADQWGYLNELVALSDEYNVKLTLSFPPGWAEYILEDEDRLKLLREWEASGYEIAAHHHGASHATWDGYTNLDSKKRDPRYLGSIDEMMDILVQLPASGEILTVSMSDAETDWPAGVYVVSEGDPQDKVDNAVSVPSSVVYNSSELTLYTKSGYLTGKLVDLDLETFLSEIDSTKEGEVLGVAFSDANFSTAGVFNGIEDLYQALAEQGVQVETLSDIHYK